MGRAGATWGHRGAELVKRALDGDRAAWEAIVDELKGVVWRVLAGYGLSREDREDAFASTFFRLFERLATIREPAKLPGWLATTARNEALMLLRARGRTVATDDIGDEPAPERPPDAAVIRGELSVAIAAAFARLPRQCQDLLRLATAEPPLSYDEIGALLDMPHGSIGPTRRRCLDRLKLAPELRPYLDGGDP
jgi:RNA polymerase sigma factor (sigma-70 family)